MFEKATKMKEKLDALRPLPSYTVQSIRDKLLLDWTYNSNAIEGNTLTLIETKVVLEGITIGGKRLSEHLEVINHKDAIIYVEEIVKNEEDLTEWQIKNIHRLVLKGIDDANAGQYRKQNVIISGAKHIPPDYLVSNDEMNRFIEWYTSKGAKEMHPIERAARVHGDFVKIHPFIDGNGRTARLLLNFELMKSGYPPIVIQNDERMKYYAALDKAHTTGDYGDFIFMVEKEVENSLNIYLNLIR
ncbi:Fic family protein [Vallitalea sp.]|jgi:Fic family protein|uniref:Fic family protein n=1 Tax=Vallitalea sp. TaxID=1882829 RepID=UPI0025F208D5|nr:Fic family protein [Vallitalea sp.]MCT4687120.1 Fic family protein [Vallitalea sp.]